MVLREGRKMEDKDKVDVIKQLSEMGFTEEDANKFVELAEALNVIGNKFFCPDGIKVILGLRAVGAFLGGILSRLPGREDTSFFFSCLSEVLASASLTYQSIESGSEVEH